jgi:hypothetical protein
VRATDDAAIDGVLVPIDGRTHLSQRVPQLSLLLPPHRHADEGHHRRRQDQQQRDDDQQLDERVAA